MVIAAYAGCGKTVFTRNTWNSIDLVCVPYKYNVTDEYVEEEAECRKADYPYMLNKDWPLNYVSAIMTAYHKYQYVLIPTIPQVLKLLQKYQIPYIICYPDRSLKNEYKKRYLARGNAEAFCYVFIKYWDSFIDEAQADTYGKHIVLETGKYLTDYRSEMEKYISACESTMQIAIDEDILEDVQEMFEMTGICIEEHLRQFMIYATLHPDIIKTWKEKGMLEISDNVIRSLWVQEEY